MENLTAYAELKNNLEIIVDHWKPKELFYTVNNIGFGSAGYISIEMVGSNWNLKKSVGCTKEFNSYGRKIWQFFSVSTNAMVDELEWVINKEIQKSGITNLKVSSVLI